MNFKLIDLIDPVFDGIPSRYISSKIFSENYTIFHYFMWAYSLSFNVSGSIRNLMNFEKPHRYSSLIY